LVLLMLKQSDHSKECQLDKYLNQALLIEPGFF